MALSPFFLLVVSLAVAMGGHVTPPGKEDNLLFQSEIDLELSAAALNVPESFQPYEEAWASFKKAFGRQYRDQREEADRFQMFLTNVKSMELHNKRFRHGNATFWMGINQFADMSQEEYQAYLSGKQSPADITENSGDLKCSFFLPPLNYAASDSVDWRTKGYVTGVKNQNKCGSCWAFSVTGALEGQHFRKTRRLVPLSEQQLVDCAGSFGPKGCEGGDRLAAYAYIYSAGGLNNETVYPYEARDDKCRFLKSKVAASLTGCKRVKSGSETDLKASVSSQGPVSVSIDASHQSFRFYDGGVYTEAQCRQKSQDLHHAVLVVGYDVTGSKDYWIVKNSWGAHWGDKGYILMARNHDNMCGIATRASFPVV